MEKIWLVGEENVVSSEIAYLCERFKIEQTIAKLLWQRGLRKEDDVIQFFKPSLNDLHDPFLMKDMDQAIVRIEEAIAANEKILIYGDYDVDGTTSVALVYRFLKKIYPNVDFYSGIVQSALGIPVSLFTGIFAMARTVGWIAQWNEMLSDGDFRIGRPRQLYIGAERRDYVPVAERG